MKKRSLLLILFLAVFYNFSYSQSNAGYLNEVWNKFDMGYLIGDGNIWCDDFDGDGTEEILFSANKGSSSYFAIMSYIDGDYRVTWHSPLYPSYREIQVLQIADPDSNDVYSIYVVLVNGEVEVYDGATMNLTETYSTNSEYAEQTEVADIDNDGDLEFLIVSSGYDWNYLHIYNIDDFSVVAQSSTYFGRDVEVGDVDGDGQNEIVLPTGYVLDGATLAEEWHYIGGFGSWVELGDINNDAIPDIISTDYSGSVKGFDAVLRTPLWEFFTPYNGNYSLKAIQDDGTKLLIGVNDYLTAVTYYDATTQQQLWACSGNDDGISDIGVGDPDNDGENEFIWGSGNHYLNIGNFNYATTEWSSDNLSGPFFVDVDDINIDDTLDIVGASNKTNSYYDMGAIVTYNGITHDLIKYLLPETWYDINCIVTGNINQTPQKEIVIGADAHIMIFDGISYNLLWDKATPSTIEDIELADFNNDGTADIIIGDKAGYITIYDGITHELIWKSIDTGNAISDIEIANIDDDDNPEIIFCNDHSIIQIYDGATFTLQWQSTTLTNLRTIDVADYDRDGVQDIISGDYGGRVHFTRCDDFTSATSFLATTASITGVLVANIDSTAQNEILVGADRLRVFKSTDFSLIWKSDRLGDNVGTTDNIKAVDLDADQHKDIVFSTDWGIFHFEAGSPFQDITPPTVKQTTPQNGMQMIGTNSDIKVVFSEEMDSQALDAHISLFGHGGDVVLATDISYNSSDYSALIHPVSALFPNDSVIVKIDALLTDTAGNGLDGNNNGLAEGSPDDDYIWWFKTGMGADTVGPEFTSLEPAVAEMWPGVPLSVSGIITDTSDFASSPINQVEYFIDNIGNNGEGIQVTAADGSYDDITENIALPVSADGWNSGEHILYFHGKDFTGNWGIFSEIVVTVETENPDNWSMSGNNPLHTGCNLQDSISFPLELAWQQPLAGSGYFNISPVCVANNRVFVSTSIYSQSNGTIKSFDLESGVENWTIEFNESATLSPPSFGYGMVYAQHIDEMSTGFLYAIDYSTGSVIWSSNFTTQWGKFRSPVVTDGRVFIKGGYIGGVYSYNAKTGDEIWYYEMSWSGNTTPAVYANKVYAYAENTRTVMGNLTALDEPFGMLQWENKDIPLNYKEINSPPVIDSVSNIIYTTSDRYFSAVDLNSHDVLWSYHSNINNLLPPAVYNQNLYFIDDGILKVVDTQGLPLWDYSTLTDDITHEPVIANGYVFVSTNQYVYAIDINTHEEVWHYNVGGKLVVGRNHLFVSGDDGILYAFRVKAMGTGVADDQSNEVILYQNTPNPATNITSISYYLPEQSLINLSVFNMQGLRVTNLVNDQESAGTHSYSLNINDFTPGVYFFRLTVNGTLTKTKKLVVVK